VTGSAMIGVEHRAHRQLRSIVETMAARGGMLEAGRFRAIDGRVLYVQERDRENHLRGVMISDSSNPDRPFVIFAEKGRFEFDEAHALFRIGLESGAIHLSSPARGGARSDEAIASPDRESRISFDRLDYALDVRRLITSLGFAKRPRQMSFDALDAVVARARAGGELTSLDQKNPVEYELEIHRRYALPFAPLLFAALAVPLGLGRLGGTPMRGVLIGLVLAMGYYGLYSEFRLLAREGWIAPAVALWLPNFLFTLVAVLLSIRAERVTGRR
jgi:lipopolysaccharide export system permease protein